MANVSSINGNPIVVGSSGISDGSITTVKLVSNSVTSDKIDNGAVSTDNLTDGAVTFDKIAESAVMQLVSPPDEADSTKFALGQIWNYEEKQPNAVNNNYKLNGDGTRSSAAGYKQKLYQCTAGQVLYIEQSKESDGTFQFQSAGASSVENLIGEAKTIAYRGFLEVPAGATYLCTCSLMTNTEDTVYVATNKLTELYKNVDTLYDALEYDRMPVTFTNGAPMNAGNAYIISSSAFPINVGETVEVIPQFAPADGYDIVYGCYYYIASSPVTSPTATGSKGLTLTSYDNTFTPTDSNTRYARVAISTSNGTTYNALRVANFDYSPVLIIKKRTPNIVRYNEDVLPSVYAAANYEHSGLGAANKYQCFSMLVTSDPHGDAVRMRNAIKYLNHIPTLQCGICLGDVLSSNFTNDAKWYSDAVDTSKKTWLTVIGNHDGGNSNQYSISGTKQEVFEKIIEPTIEKIGLPSLTKTYYALTFSSFKVVVIVIDIYDVPDTIDGSGNFVVGRQYEGYTQAQIDWLVTTLANVPAGYAVIIAQHAGGSNRGWVVDECAFTKPNSTIGSMGITYADPIVNEIVEAWKDGAVLSKSYQPSIYQEYMPTLTVDADFSGRGSGLFACYIVGHAHWDTIAHDGNDQLCVQVDTTANHDNYQNNWTDLPRAHGTKAEDCITVIGVDVDKRLVKVVRVGANVTEQMTKRDMISFGF